jgi:nucleoside-diphosphate-sugar epimerase
VSRLLVTGAAGFVGARVVRLALERGHTVTAAVAPSSGAQRMEALHGQVEILAADMADADALVRLATAARADACIHLAAVGAVAKTDDLPELMAVNALAPARLAEALARHGCTRLVTVGSSSEYGSCDGPMHESAAPAPDDFYGVAKLAGGLLARVAGAAAGLETVHARPFSVYGPGEDRTRLVASVVHALIDGQPLALTPGNQVRDFVYVDDVADALLIAAERPGLDGVTVNLGTGVETSVRELCRIAAELAGRPGLLRFGAREYRDGERFHWRAATEQAEQLLGWRASTDLRSGLERTFAAAEPCATLSDRRAA